MLSIQKMIFFVHIFLKYRIHANRAPLLIKMPLFGPRWLVFKTKMAKSGIQRNPAAVKLLYRVYHKDPIAAFLVYLYSLLTMPFPI